MLVTTRYAFIEFLSDGAVGGTGFSFDVYKSGVSDAACEASAGAPVAVVPGAPVEIASHAGVDEVQYPGDLACDWAFIGPEGGGALTVEFSTLDTAEGDFVKVHADLERTQLLGSFHGRPNEAVKVVSRSGTLVVSFTADRLGASLGFRASVTASDGGDGGDGDGDGGDGDGDARRQCSGVAFLDGGAGPGHIAPIDLLADGAAGPPVAGTAVPEGLEHLHEDQARLLAAGVTYEPLALCEWLLNPPGGCEAGSAARDALTASGTCDVTFSFDYLDTQANADTVSFYRAAADAAPLHSFSGSAAPDAFIVPDVDGPLLVEFASDSTTQRSGFRLRYAFGPSPAECAGGCGAGGRCVHGRCSCAPLWTGEACETRVPNGVWRSVRDWSGGGPPGFNRFGKVVTVDDDTAYYFGGTRSPLSYSSAGSDRYRTLYRFRLSDARWDSLDPADGGGEPWPQARARHVMEALPEPDAGGTVTSDGMALSEPGGAYPDQTPFLVHGGRTRLTAGVDTLLNDTWVYEPDAGRWREVVATGGAPLAGVAEMGACVLASGQLVVLHGETVEPAGVADRRGSDYVGRVAVLSFTERDSRGVPVAGRWHVLRFDDAGGAGPAGRRYPTATCFGNTVALAAGRDGQGTTHSDTWLLDLSAVGAAVAEAGDAAEAPSPSQWRQTSPGGAVPRRRFAHTAVRRFGSSALYVGGFSDDADVTDVTVYEHSSNRLRNLDTPFEYPQRGRPAAAAFPGGAVIMVGGQGSPPNAYYGDTWVLTDSLGGTNSTVDEAYVEELLAPAGSGGGHGRLACDTRVFSDRCGGEALVCEPAVFESVAVRLVARDAFGQRRFTGGDSVTASVAVVTAGGPGADEPVPAAVTDHGDGSYTVRLPPVWQRGCFRAQVLVNGEPLASDLPVYYRPGPAAFVRATLAPLGAGELELRAGGARVVPSDGTAQVSVRVFDRFGVSRTLSRELARRTLATVEAPDGSVSVVPVLLGPDSVPGGDPRYVVQLPVTAAGRHKLRLNVTSAEWADGVVPAAQLAPGNWEGFDLEHELHPVEYETRFDFVAVGDSSPGAAVYWTMVGLAVAVAALVAATAAAVAWMRRSPVIRASSVLFCLLILAGLIALLAVVPVYGLGGPDTLGRSAMDRRCRSMPWLLSAGFALVFGCLFAKALRVSRLFNSRLLMKRPISSRTLLSIVGGIFAYDAILLVVVEQVDRVHSRTRLGSDTDTYQACSNKNTWLWGSLYVVQKVAVIGWGAVVAWKTRDAPTAFNESRAISMLIAVAAFVLTTTVPASIASTDKPTTAFVLVATSILFVCVAVLVYLFAPKLYVAYVRPEMNVLTAEDLYAAAAKGPRPYNKQSRRSGSAYRSGTEDADDVSEASQPPAPRRGYLGGMEDRAAASSVPLGCLSARRLDAHLSRKGRVTVAAGEGVPASVRAKVDLLSLRVSRAMAACDLERFRRAAGELHELSFLVLQEGEPGAGVGGAASGGVGVGVTGGGAEEKASEDKGSPPSQSAASPDTGADRSPSGRQAWRDEDTTSSPSMGAAAEDDDGAASRAAAASGSSSIPWRLPPLSADEPGVPASASSASSLDAPSTRNASTLDLLVSSEPQSRPPLMDL